MFEQVLNEVIPEYEDRISFYKVNIEQEPRLSEIFEVRHIPHFVMISKDGGVTPGSGAKNKDTIKYFLEGLISK
jgi:thioredoxin-like negative regulator of GroEL